jgi:hypothetical protein
MFTLAQIANRLDLLCTSGSRYDDQGDGTVLDCNTGLLWLKDAGCIGPVANWNDAVSGVAGLNSGECGLSDGSREGDWRLPEVWELCSSVSDTGYGTCAGDTVTVATSLVNANCPPPAVSNAEGSECWSPEDPFIGVGMGNWSATEYGADDVWAVNLNGGFVWYGSKGASGFYGWPVRAQAKELDLEPPAKAFNEEGQPAPTMFTLSQIARWRLGLICASGNRYEDQRDGTVLDCNTGLYWLKDASCLGRLRWELAMNAANSLNTGECGLSDGSQEGDWRLPRLSEFCASWDGHYCQGDPSTIATSLLNANCSNPAVSNTEGSECWSPEDPFIGVRSAKYWSSRRVTNYHSAVHLGESWYWDIRCIWPYNTCPYVWPVRGGP